MSRTKLALGSVLLLLIVGGLSVGLGVSIVKTAMGIGFHVGLFALAPGVITAAIALRLFRAGPKTKTIRRHGGWSAPSMVIGGFALALLHGTELLAALSALAGFLYMFFWLVFGPVVRAAFIWTRRRCSPSAAG